MTTVSTNPQASHLPWTQGQVCVDGVGLRFHRTGRRDRPALLLAHGLSDSGRCWGRVATALGEHFDVVMPDARNHGGSDTAPTSPDLLAADIASVISLLGLDRPIVIGHSVGAHTAALFAARFPLLVSQLVLEDPPWTSDRVSNAAAAQRRAEIITWLGSLGAMTEADMAALGRKQHPGWSDDDYPAWIESNLQVRVEAVDGLDFGDWPDVVTAIACPTLLVLGESARDAIVTPSTADRITELNTHITSAFIQGAGHNIRRENFDRFMQVVANFLLGDLAPALPDFAPHT